VRRAKHRCNLAVNEPLNTRMLAVRKIGRDSMLRAE
jgi:hypothetical protein